MSVRRVLAAGGAVAVVLAGLLLPTAALAAEIGAETGAESGAESGPGTAASLDVAAIDHAQPSEDGLQLLVSVPLGAEPDLAGVEVTVGGETVGATAAPAAEDALVRRTTVLAIDTSISMRGERIAAAEAAARTYLDTVPADVEVGVVTFDDDVEVVLSPTRDRDAARAAVEDLALTRQTALYDGVLGAIEAAGPAGDDAGQRKVLVLSDGRDSTSRSLSAALRGVEESGVLLDVVALQQQGAGALPLRLLADAGRGVVLDAADPAALGDAFAQEAQALARQVVVSAAVPQDADASSDVTVTFASTDGGDPVEASAYVAVRPEADPAALAAREAEQREALRAAATADIAAPEVSPLASEVLVWGGLGALGVGLVGLVLTLALTRTAPDQEEQLRTQLQAYGVFGATPSEAPGAAAAAGGTDGLGGHARDAAQRLLASRSGLEGRIAERLEGAGMRLKPPEWLLVHAGIGLAGATLGLLLGRGHVLLLLAGLAIGAVGPMVYLRLKRARRLAAFSASLADTLQLMSGSLSAGLSLAQSIDTIVREGAEPMSGELRRVVVESRLGVPLEDALEGVAERMGSRDFAWVVMAIRIQREVGGNLAELLLQVAATLREREFVRRHVRALSAEGRLSAWVLGGLPPGFLLYLTASKPDYVNTLYTTPIGWVLLGGMAVLMLVGVVWMSKVAKVEL